MFFYVNKLSITWTLDVYELLSESDLVIQILWLTIPTMGWFLLPSTALSSFYHVLLNGPKLNLAGLEQNTLLLCFCLFYRLTFY